MEDAGACCHPCTQRAAVPLEDKRGKKEIRVKESKRRVKDWGAGAGEKKGGKRK